MSVLLTPEALTAQAHKLYRSGNFTQAASLFLAVEDHYKMEADLLQAAEMSNNRCVSLLQAGNPEGALDALEGTVKIFEDFGDLRRLAMTWGNRAAALATIGQNDEAEDAYWRASELFKEIGESDLYLSTMRSLSELQLQSHRFLESVSSMQSGLNQMKKPNLAHQVLKRLFKIPARLMNR